MSGTGLLVRQGDARMSGTIANLAAAANATLVVDLQVHARTNGAGNADVSVLDLATVQVSVSAPAGTGTVTAYFGDTPTPATTRPAAEMLSGRAFKALNLSGGEFVGVVPVLGRFLYLAVSNSGAGAFSAGATVAVAAYRG